MEYEMLHRVYINNTADDGSKLNMLILKSI